MRLVDKKKHFISPKILTFKGLYLQLVLLHFLLSEVDWTQLNSALWLHKTLPRSEYWDQTNAAEKLELLL